MIMCLQFACLTLAPHLGLVVAFSGHMITICYDFCWFPAKLAVGKAGFALTTA